MLPAAFLSRPIAHRGLHDLANGRPENSRAAVEAAIAHGYGIEIDLQLTSDQAAVVFHDYDLERLTDGKGKVRDLSRADLSSVPLTGGNESVPEFAEILALVAGRAPLLVEMKDQDGRLGPNVGPLEAAVARDLESYAGPVAVMSFNPHSVAALKDLAPDLPRGLVTELFDDKEWDVPEDQRKALNAITDFDRVGAAFISHNHRHLDTDAVAALKARAVPVLCWTTRSLEEDRAARRVADNVTFEGYLPEIPA